MGRLYVLGYGRMFHVPRPFSSEATQRPPNGRPQPGRWHGELPSPPETIAYFDHVFLRSTSREVAAGLSRRDALHRRQCFYAAVHAALIRATAVMLLPPPYRRSHLRTLDFVLPYTRAPRRCTPLEHPNVNFRLRRFPLFRRSCSSDTRYSSRL